MDAALQALQVDVATCQSFENLLRGKPEAAEAKARGGKSSRAVAASAVVQTRTVEAVLDACMEACKASRKRHLDEAGPGDDRSDAGLSQYTRFTDGIALKDYEQFLHYVPRLVNVVTYDTTARAHACDPLPPATAHSPAPSAAPQALQ